MAEAQAPRIRTEFPHAVEVHDNVPITLADGTVLRACLWLAAAAAARMADAAGESGAWRWREGSGRRRWCSRCAYTQLHSTDETTEPWGMPRV